jgi:energy-coupling factor transporter ATP-binding protein EcfA2
MSGQRYTASRSLTKDGTSWVMNFRHPLRKDPRGKQGRKVRRGLGTADEAKAQALVDEMNLLLGDAGWHSIARRPEAERRFDPLVVRAFYDDIEAQPANSWDIRNEALRLLGREEGYARVMLVGPTGGGKTSLLRHLIGSHPDTDRFPSTSASRTTISDIEVITAEDAAYKAVVTFFNEWAVHTSVHECVADACAALWDKCSDDRLAERLLTHRDLRFRLGYIIGSWKQVAAGVAGSADDGWNYADGGADGAMPADDAEGALPTEADVQRMHQTLSSFLKRIRDLAAEAKRDLRSELNVEIDTLTESDKEAAQDLFEDIVQSLPDFDELVNDIMDEIRARFALLGAAGTPDTHPNGWPRSWSYETADRDEFVRTVRRFSSNYAPAYGTLLTPLVDGIRMQGRFFPRAIDRHPKLVLLDGEGLGHVGDPAAGVATRVARRFGDVDVILLVDMANTPMLEGPTSLLRAVAASGYQKKLGMAFTKFDLVRGQANLPTFALQRAHVLSPVHQKLASLRDVVGVPAVRAIERDLEARCFMLGFLDKPLTEKNRGPVAELSRLIDLCEAAIAPETLPEAQPVYDTATLVLAIQAATTDFHARWDAILGLRRSGNIRTAHWAEVKALNRRIVLEIEASEYKDLRPVADLVARLAESVTRFLDNPIRWKPRPPADAEAEQALSRVQRAVFGRLHEFVEARLLRVPRADWTRAFDYSGPGSTFDRRRVIQTIYDASAPIPGPVLDTRSEHFLRDVRRLLHEAIAEGGGELVSDVLGQPGA